MPSVTIEKLVFGGQGLGRVDGQVSFVWGAWPGEEVEFVVTKKKKNFLEGVVTKVIAASPHRIEPAEEHYLSCSPWQTISYAQENSWKKTIAQETFQKIGGVNLGQVELTSPDNPFHYRNKMEYGFYEDENKSLSLALHHRGTHFLRSVTGCVLADPIINQVGERIISWLKSLAVPRTALKSVIIRSNRRGECIAALFVKDRGAVKESLALDTSLRGFSVYWSDPRSPASTPNELLISAGENFLKEKILETDLSYGLISFFQINVEMFAIALKDIVPFLKPAISIVDYYSGVGSISLPLHQSFASGVLIENNAEAVAFAQENILKNHIVSATAVASDAGRASDHISNDKIIVLDPPRTGLDKTIMAALLKSHPPRIVYLSCDIGTQARDFGLLKDAYKPIFWRIYNFFPRTPHIESLLVLEHKLRFAKN